MLPDLGGPMPLLATNASQRSRSRLAAWGLAVSVTLAAFLLTHGTPALAQFSSFLLPFASILLSGWVGGWRCAATSTILATLLLVKFTLPGEGLSVVTAPDNAIRLLAFVGLSAVVTVYHGLLERATARIDATDLLVRTVVQSAPILIAGADDEGRIALFNAACEQLTGLRREDVLGKPFVNTLVPEHARRTVVDRFSIADEAGLARPHTNPWNTRHGERVLEWRCFRLASPNGRGTFVLGVGQDVTERRAAEDALRRAMQVEELMRTQAEEGKQMMQRALATVSHEMRGPLAVLMGRLRMLELQSAGQGVQRTVQPLQRNAAVLKKLADDLVEFSRIAEGKLRLRVQPVSPSEFLDNFLASARTLARDRNIAVDDEIPPALPVISADPERLQQVLLNLFANAVKFSPFGGRVRLAAQHEDGSVRISITDSGDGVPPEHLARIFEPFWQLPNKTSEKQGLGLGLAVVKELVTRHGGTVAATQDPSGGLTVSVLLPVAQDGELVSAG